MLVSCKISLMFHYTEIIYPPIYVNDVASILWLLNPPFWFDIKRMVRERGLGAGPLRGKRAGGGHSAQGVSCRLPGCLYTIVVTRLAKCGGAPRRPCSGSGHIRGRTVQGCEDCSVRHLKSELVDMDPSLHRHPMRLFYSLNRITWPLGQ